MEIHLFVEERSAKAALSILVPRILKDRAAHRIIEFSGKTKMLAELPSRLRGYRKRLEREDLRILILIDEDREDCRALKTKLEGIAREAGLVTKTAAGQGPFRVVTRIAVEELEAWYFGDHAALYAGYDRLPKTLHQKKPYRDPDAIKGGTCEQLHRELVKAGYDFPHFPKIAAARIIAERMDPAVNRSRSFQTFRSGLESFLS